MGMKRIALSIINFSGPGKLFSMPAHAVWLVVLGKCLEWSDSVFYSSFPFSSFLPPFRPLRPSRRLDFCSVKHLKPVSVWRPDDARVGIAKLKTVPRANRRRHRASVFPCQWNCIKCKYFKQQRQKKLLPLTCLQFGGSSCTNDVRLNL